MTTNAAIGYGVLFQRATNTTPPYTWATIGEINAPPAYAPSRDTIDATHSESPDRYREYISGLRDGGEVSIGVNLIIEGQDYVNALADFDSNVSRAYRILFPTGANVVFVGFMTEPAQEVPLDDKMTATFTYKVDGKPTFAAGVSPVNVLRPAISGVAQAGQVLTAYEGSWNTGGAFTYQWQELITSTWTNISGATGRQLTVPGAPTIGRSLRVRVTLTNAAGNATADSVGTVVVIA